MSETVANGSAGAADVAAEALGAAVPLILFAESPVHAGAGAATENIDLPIQRSVHTRWPILNDSTVRGGLRRLAEAKCDAGAARIMFGDGRQAGAFATPDAELLLFPVEAAKGITAWLTCVQALRRFLRKLDLCGDMAPAATTAANSLRQALETIGAGPVRDAATGYEVWSEYAGSADMGDGLLWKNGTRVVVAEDAFHVRTEKVEANGPDPKACMASLGAWVEDYLIPTWPSSAAPANLAQPPAGAGTPAASGAAGSSSWWANFIRRRLVLVHDHVFTHYVKLKTETRTRNAISEGTARAGALWREENLPVDSVLFTVLAATGDSTTQFETFVKETGLGVGSAVLQLGGDQNLGRGWLRVWRLGRRRS